MSLSNDDHRPVLVSRAARLSRISALIRSEQISSQAELARRLAAEGIVVSQGTLSRDLKDVGAARGRDQLGNFQYSIPEGEHPSQMTTGLPARNHLVRMCQSLCIAVNYNNGAVVIKTPRAQHSIWVQLLTPRVSVQCLAPSRVTTLSSLFVRSELTEKILQGCSVKWLRQGCQPRDWLQ